MANRNPPRKEDTEVHREFRKQVESKEARKVKSRHTKKTVWFGLGMFGIIGWSVAIPMVMGVALGIWIDTKWPSRFSWTLMLLVAGLIVGCFNAWYWITRESRNE